MSEMSCRTSERFLISMSKGQACWRRAAAGRRRPRGGVTFKKGGGISDERAGGSPMLRDPIGPSPRAAGDRTGRATYDAACGPGLFGTTSTLCLCNRTTSENDVKHIANMGCQYHPRACDNNSHFREYDGCDRYLSVSYIGHLSHSPQATMSNAHPSLPLHPLPWRGLTNRNNESIPSIASPTNEHGGALPKARD
jgi:hypothetical protein